MKVLVTGGCGFIGSHVVDQYLADGHDVVVLDNLSTGNKNNLDNRATLVEGDITDYPIADLLAQHHVEVINHQAAQVNVRHSIDDPGFDLTTNTHGTIRLLEAAKENGVKKFIFASTGGAVYGEQENYPCKEDVACNPASPYAISKLASEFYIKFFNLSYQLPFVVLRYANVYGPRQDPKGEAGVVSIFIESMLKGETPTIFGDGKQTRDYVFVEDVAAANVAALAIEQTGVYNVGTSKETTVNDLFFLLRELLKLKFDANHGDAIPGELFRSAVDISLSGNVLKWQPKAGLPEGLAKTIRFFKDRI